jgi:mannitol/fructose-specific phosphotransferase system IIA component (Ntr-type)
MTIKLHPITPWKMGTPCPIDGYTEFRRALMDASYHFAGQRDEMAAGRCCVTDGASIAIAHGWPVWVIKRAVTEVKSLVDYDTLMQAYVHILIKAANAGGQQDDL